MHLLLAVVSLLACQNTADTVSRRVITPAELELYRAHKPVVEYTTQELKNAYPELSHLQLRTEEEDLGPLLRHVGERVATMFHDLPNTASREDVRRSYRGLAPRQESTMRDTYDYLFLARSVDGFTLWDEVRTGRDGKPIVFDKLQGKGLLTSGYAGLAYFFHPRQQKGSRYRYVGRELSKPMLHVLAFAQKAESADSLGSITTEGTDYPLLFQGLAWVDPGNQQIIRMRVGLLAPRPDLGLYRQDTEIWFTEVRFDDIDRALWLPREVVVTIEWRNRSFRNRHRYSDYRLFTVETYEKHETPAVP